jgi:thiamine kinase-like enzyme
MIVDQKGRLLVVDWENSGLGPIAWDLRNLFRHAEECVLSFLQSVSEPGALPPDEQMRVVSAVDLIRGRRNRERDVAYRSIQLGQNRDHAAKVLADRDATLIARIRGRYH